MKGDITTCGLLHLYDPDGHSFFIKEGSSRQTNQIYKISLNTPDLNKTIGMWCFAVDNLNYHWNFIKYGRILKS